MTDIPTDPDQLLEFYNGLTESIYTGVTTVTYDGKSTTFRSLNDMIRLHKDLESKITGKPRVRRVLTNSEKGL